MPSAAFDVRDNRICPTCQAPFRYDVASHGLRCDYCNTLRPVQRYQLGSSHPLAEPPKTSATAALRCTQCGAVARGGGRVVATRCAFCTSPVVEVTAEGGEFDGIVPFEIDGATFAGRLKRWFRWRLFAPLGFARAARVENARAVYVPVWMFQCDAASKYEAEVTNQKDADGTPYDFRPRSGEHDGTFQVLVSASAGLPEQELRATRWFDDPDPVQVFQPAFLCGFDAEEPGVPPETMWPAARQLVLDAAKKACEDAAHENDPRRGWTYMYVHLLDAKTELSDPRYFAVLVPLYVCAYRYGRKVYRALVNGRTGEVVGTAPVSRWKVALVVLAALGLVVKFLAS